MKKLLGPMLYVTDSQAADTWTFAVNLYLSGTDPARPPAVQPKFLDANGQDLRGAVVTGPELAADFSRLNSSMAGVLWTWRVSLQREPRPTRVAYRFVSPDGAPALEGMDDVKDVVVPERGALPRAAFFSCNGGGTKEVWKEVLSMEHPVACWEDMLIQHKDATGGFHLLIGGGDQVYADSIWYTSQALKEFREMSLRKKQQHRDLPQGFHDEMVARYVEIYCDRWGDASGIAPMLARVPGLFTWDDHDIFDGWGSYEELQGHPRYQTMYSAAALAYEAFQLGGLRTADKTPSERKPGETHYLRTVRYTGDECDMDVVMLDLRSGRTFRERAPGKLEHVVMSDAQWAALDAWRQEHRAAPETGSKDRHVLVVSSVPLVHLRFGPATERLAGLGGGLRDDMLDQWESIVHRGERTRLIMDLFKLARESCCAVTVISGDVHVGARGLIRSRNPEHLFPGLSEATIEQVTSSAIVHPPPGMLEFLGMRMLAGEGVEDLPSFMQTELLPVGADHYLRERNWLSLSVKRPASATSRPKLWLRWEAEHTPLSMQVVVEPPPLTR